MMHRSDTLSFSLLLLLAVAAAIVLGSPTMFAQSGGEALPDSTDFIAPGRGDVIDSVFHNGRWVRLKVKVADDIRNDSLRLAAMIDSVLDAREAIVAANLALDPLTWQPTEADKARRQEEIDRMTDFEYIYPQNITRVPLASIPISSIAQSLGLVEDTSPKIAYVLDRTRTVTVKIYTQSALPIATLVEGSQKPGEYRFDWDFNDANGRRVLRGSYFAEVIADGDTLLARKRIVVP